MRIVRCSWRTGRLTSHALGAWALAVLAAIAGCGASRAYNCTSDEQCRLDGAAGRCEVDGFCSFPDVLCASGSRYGTHAPAALRGACVTPPLNDVCDGSLPLLPGEPIEGMLRGGAPTGLLTCSPQVTSDVFYTLDLGECSDVTLRAAAPGGNLGVAMTRACDEVLGCTDAAQTSAPETLEVVGVPPGSYQVGVGGVFYDGDFTLSAAIAPPPVNDELATAAPLTLGASSVQSLARANDSIALCDGRTGGRDVFFRLPLPAYPDESWVVDIGASGHTADDHAVALLDGQGTPFACAATSTGPVRFHDVPAADYVLAVDGPTDGSCGRFDLEATTKRVQDNNRCTSATELGVLTFGGFRVDGDLEKATPEYAGSCGGTGNDVVYRMVVPERAHVSIRATEKSGGFTPIVYLREAATDCATAAEVTYRPRGTCGPGLVAADAFNAPMRQACERDPSSPHLDIEWLEPGTYDIVVDSEDGAGRYELVVDRLRPFGDSPPGTELIGACFDGGCCDVGSSIGAQVHANACSASAPDVFRTIPIPEGCSAGGTISVVSATPHRISTSASAGCVSTPACGTVPVQGGDGLFLSTVDFGVHANDSTCSLEVRVQSQDAADQRGYFLVRYRNAPPLLCM